MHCGKCKTTEGSFIKNSISSSGKYSYYCRSCNTERAKKYRATAKGKEKIYKAVYKSMKKHAAKHSARVSVCYHVKKGNLEKPSKCSVCKKESTIYAHHPDYSKPLEVIWLCRDCHCEEHRK